MTRPLSTLLFGGTFDPPHLAHVELPMLVADEIACDRVLYVPAAINPLKAKTPPTPQEHRLAMLEIALRDQPRASISTIELERDGPSYFVDTLEEIAEQEEDAGDAEGRSGATRRFLIGADQAVQFHRWRSWERILELAEPAVMLRPPWDEASFHAALTEAGTDESARDAWMRRIVIAPLRDIDGTTIRRLLREGEDVSHLLDPAVLAYIHRHGLYGVGRSSEA